MRKSSCLAGAALALVGTLFVLTASAADRPVRRNKDFSPAANAASSFSFVTTGVIAKITKASIAADGTITARFTITDSKGRGLDADGIATPGAVTLRFVAAYIPNGKTQYVAYTVTTLKATINNNPSQIQASTDSGGVYTLVDAATGTYDYVFKTKVPANYDATATHSIGMQAERNLAEFGFATFSSDDVFTWVPNGSPVSTVRDVVNEASCNKCHDPISAHGGGRKKMAYCVLCHTPQSTNPDTNNSVDMGVFIHKLHSGASLPSVKAGKPYQIFHRGAMVDYSDINYPRDIRDCNSCHAAGPKQVDNWKTKPTRALCGSCHDDVNFATGANHVNTPQADDTQCASCHAATAKNDFDTSVPGAHVIPNFSTSLPGIVMQVQKVDNATPGNAPVVTFKVADKSGKAIDISKLTQIRVVLSGPNVDYQTGTTGVRVSEDPSKTAGTNGVYVYTMTTKIPAGSTGSYTVSLEARNSVTLMAGTPKETVATDMAMPVEYYFAVDGSKTAPRRVVVSTEKCAACHRSLGFIHGGTRGNTQECVICHNPTLVDGTSKQPVSFATQIHSTHRGKALANPYILGTTNYQDVGYPGDLRDCNQCHVGTSYQVDNVGAQANIVSTGWFLPSTPPIQAACQGCHDDRSTALHAQTNTSGKLGEACIVCHGNGANYAVDKVHAH